MGRFKLVCSAIALCVILSSGCANRGVGSWAVSEDGTDFVGRYIGGGSHHAGPRRPTEGTWARDYAGLDIFHLIDLRWAHSPLAAHDGIGSY
jgi:hypothetical protein